MLLTDSEALAQRRATTLLRAILVQRSQKAPASKSLDQQVVWLSIK